MQAWFTIRTTGLTSNLLRKARFFYALNAQISTIFLLLLLLWSCGAKKTNSTVEVLSVNPLNVEEFVNLSEIADSIKCIRLQTEDDDAIGMVGTIVIKEKCIYVSDLKQQAVFVFDKEGKFVSKLSKRGDGPDEYRVLGPVVFIDDDERYIEVLDFAAKKILKYSSTSHELLGVEHFPALTFNSWKRKTDFYYCATQQIDNVVNDENTNAGLIVVDSKGKVKTLFDKKIDTGGANRVYNWYFAESFTENDRDELFLTLMYDNTFYRLEEGEAHPVFTVDFGKYGMDNSIGTLSTRKQIEYIQDMNNKAAFPVLNTNNTNIMSFSYFFKQGEMENVLGLFREDDFRQYLKFKESGKVFHVKYIKNDLSSFPSRIHINAFRNFREVWYKDYLVDVVMPEQYFNKITKEKIVVDGVGTITAEDNPIIVMMKLKK